MARATLLTLCLIFISIYAPAQTFPARFERLSLEDGISHNLVYAILQDRSGFMWFGSMYGLIKYDGVAYRVYRHNPSDSASISFDDVISLIEDSYGNLWVGTWGGGLNRLNPETETFARYLHDPSDPRGLSHNTVWALLETADSSANTLWIGTERGGLNRLVLSENLPRGAASTPQSDAAYPDSFIHYVYDPADSLSLPSNLVRALYADRDGNLWIAGHRGLARLDQRGTGKERFFRYQHNPADSASLPSDNIMAICQDDSGALWIGTAGAGLAKMVFDESGKLTLLRRYRHDPANPHSLADNAVNLIREDRNGVLWIGTSGGLSLLAPANRDRGHFLNYRHDPAHPASLSGDAIVALHEDRAGIIWIGSYFGGVNFFAPGKIKFAHDTHHPYDKSSLSHPRVTAIAQDPAGTLWVATAGGLNRALPAAALPHPPSREAFSGPAAATSRFENVSLNPAESHSAGEEHVTALCVSRFSPTPILWVGTGGNGLFALPANGNSSRQPRTHHRHDPADPRSLPGNFVTVLLEDRFGALWVGTVRGLARAVSRGAEGKHFRRYAAHPGNPDSLGHNWILCLYEDSAAGLWIGSYGGLSRYDRRTGAFRTYRHDLHDPRSLSHDYVYAISRDSRGWLWIATSNGLNRFEPESETFISYTERDGLPNSVICGILEDTRGNLWLSTQKGISRFDPETRAIRNYDLDDGLQSNIFTPGASFRSSRGELFFGGINGFNRFFPEKISDNVFVPPVHLTGVKVFGQPVRINPASPLPVLELSHHQNHLTFEFAALDYATPRKNCYAYRLEGLEREWNDAGHRHAVNYPGLNPGEYVFSVKASNSDGIWNEKGTSVKIIIRPPFWQRGWFYLACAGLLGFIALALHRYRLRSKVRQALLLERERQRERDRVREKTARDYHDELGHQLTKISLYSELLCRDLGESPDHFSNGRREYTGANGLAGMDSPGEFSNGFPSRVLNYLHKINHASQHLCTDTRDFIWALDPEKDSLYETALHLKRFGEDLFEETGIEFRVEGISQAFNTVKLSMEWRRHLSLLFKEALNNAFKHAGCRTVRLQFSVTGENLQIILSDDGKGMLVEANTPGNGLPNMKKRAEKIGGKLEIISQPGRGSSIRFCGKIPGNAEAGKPERHG